MLLLLPITCFILLCLHYLTEDGVRIAILNAALTIGVFVNLSTELLSSFNELTPINIAAAWGGLLLLEVGLMALRYRQAIVSCYKYYECLGEAFRLLSVFPLTWVSFITVISLLAFTGFICPPNNWDSLTYHLPRLFHWLANSSVGIYETSCLRQIQMPPLSEYGLMHLWTLTGFEGVFNLQQLCALAMSAVAASRIASSLGASISGQLLSGFLTMSSWPVVLQATTPKNDILVGMFLLIAVLSAFRLLYDVPSHTSALCLGASVALGLSTKGTAYILFTPLIAIIAMILLHDRRWATVAAMSFSLLFACLLINGPFWQRNMAAFGSPIVGSADYTNASFGVSTTIVNVLRTSGSSLATSNGFVNQAIERSIRSTLQLVGLQEKAGTTFGDSDFAVSNRIANEDYAPYHLHIVFFLVAIALEFGRRRTNRQKRFLLLAIILLEGLLFCSISRWQIWITRLQIPLAMLLSAWLGVVISANVGVKIWRIGTTEAIVAVAFCSCLPVLFCNDLKRLFGQPNNLFDTSQELMLFASNPMVAEEQIFVCRELRKLSLKLKRPVQLGLVAHEDNYEYPLWTLGNARVWPLVNMDDIQKKDFLDAVYIVDGQSSSLHFLQNVGIR